MTEDEIFVPHKAKNTFKFLGFREKVRNLRVSTRNIFLTRSTNPDETQTFFADALLKWKDLNLTADFQNLQTELGNQLQTIPQLILHEKHIVSCLTKCLRIYDSPALIPTLQLLIALSNDLPNHIYFGYFYDILPILFTHLETKDAERIEAIFLALASFFVTFQNYLKDEFFKLLFEKQYYMLLTEKYPWYINELAAQSLCFIIRKHPKKKSIFCKMFEMLEKESMIKGVGRLIASVIKSDVMHRLHSCTSDVLMTIFDLLCYEETSAAASLSVFFAVQEVCIFVTKKSSEICLWRETWVEDQMLFWPVLWNKLDSLLSIYVDSEHSNHLLILMQVLQITISHNKDLFITERVKILDNLVKVLNVFPNETVTDVIVDIFCKIYPYENTLEYLTKFLQGLFSLNFTSLVLNFLEKNIESHYFIESILPETLKYLNRIVGLEPSNFSDVLRLLYKIVTSYSLPSKLASDLDCWKKLPLDISLLGENMKQYFVGNIDKGIMNNFSNFEELIMSLICLPHLTGFDYIVVVPLLKFLLDGCFSFLKISTNDHLPLIDISQKKRYKTENDFIDSSKFLSESLDLVNIEVVHKVSFLISITTEILVHMLPDSEFLTILDNDVFISIFKNCDFREDEHLLRAFDIYLSVAFRGNRSDILSGNFCSLVFEILAPTLSSSNHLSRLLVCHILSLFPYGLPFLTEEKVENMFVLMFRIESTPVSATDYKERVRLLALLDSQHIKSRLPVDFPVEHAPLLFYIGQLHINFKELWSPVLNFIASYSDYFSNEIFWKLIIEKLQTTSLSIRNEKHSECFAEFKSEEQFIVQLHNELSVSPALSNIIVKTDKVNFRNSLIKAMQLSPNVWQSKNRHVVSLFFEFLEKELALNLKEVEITDDACAPDLAFTNLKSTKKRSLLSALEEYLTLFSKFSKPKSLYQSNKLERLYLRLLYYPVPKIQRLALNCIFSYNHKYLNPYKEYMYKIQNDQTFKVGLLSFKIDDCSNEGSVVILEEHRNELMQILLRILYAKMCQKMDSKSSGKNAASIRKAIIFRFLAGLRNDEWDVFLYLAFKFLGLTFKESALEMVTKNICGNNSFKSVSLKKVKGVYNTIENILEKVGNLMTKKLSYLMKVTLYCVSAVFEMSQHRDELPKGYLAILKKLKHSGMMLILSFFSKLVNYEWSDEEIEAVFCAIVWPNLSSVHVEDPHNITPLLKLFELWSRHIKFQVLLSKNNSKCTFASPLQYIFKILNHEKCSHSVMEVIFGIIENLLTVKSEDNSIKEVTVETSISCAKSTEASLIDPFMDDLFKQMKIILLKLAKGKKVSDKYLNVLNLLAPHIKTPASADTLLKLIVPLITSKSVRREEQVTYLLNISSGLIAVCKKPSKLVPSLLDLFSLLKSRDSRNALCSTIQNISTRCFKLQSLAVTALNLNSWSPKLIEEIDYERRFAQFQASTDLLKVCSEIDVSESILMIHNCFFCLCNLIDSSLRDSSSYYLLQLVDTLARLHSTSVPKFNSVFVNVFLPILARNIVHTVEKVRNEIIIIFGRAVVKCSDFVPRLMDLKKLTDENDPETDFFFNIAHIQKHRRARAFEKLTDKILHKSIIFNKDTFTRYLIPLVSVHINKECVKDEALISSAVKCLGAIARQLSWHSYTTLLKLHIDGLLKKRDQFKIRIKIVDEILDAFHENVQEMPFTITEADPHAENKNNAKPKQICTTLIKKIIPRIQKTLSQKVERDSKHKSNKNAQYGEEEILKIPLIYTFVRLLKKLPQKVLDQNIQGILLRLINYLKSESFQVRNQARDVLCRVIKTVGDAYLPGLIRDLRTLLTKGFHRHVLSYTVFSIIERMRFSVAPQYMALCLNGIILTSTEDIFSEKAEEKNVSSIISKVKEAKAVRGYSLLTYAAENINVELIQNIIDPLQDVLSTTVDKKVVNKVSKCLLCISKGIETNNILTLENKAIFIYGILKNKILNCNEREESDCKVKCTSPDSLLLLPEPRKAGTLPKMTRHATSYVLVEFSLQLLYILMKNGKFSEKADAHVGLLDPYAQIISKYINSDYPEVSLAAFHVISYLIKFPLPSLKTCIFDITGQIFVFLSKYGACSITKGKMFEVLQVSFKLIAQIISNVSYYSIEKEHAQILIHYVQENLEDNNKHTTVYAILYAILSRKVNTPEVHKLLKVVRNLSITSNNEIELGQARKAYFEYFINYPISLNAINENMFYFLGNASYPSLLGRLSALLMVRDILAKFPKRLINKEMEISMWFKLSEQLACEESKESALLLEKCLQNLYLQSRRKSHIVKLCLKLLNEDPAKSNVQNAKIMYVGACSLNSFISILPEKCPRYFRTDVAPLISSLLEPSRFVPISDSYEGELSILDSTLLILLSVFENLVVNRISLKLWRKSIGKEIWYYIQQHLQYPHLHVRLKASCIIGKLFSFHSIDGKSKPPIAYTPQASRQLVLDFCEQLNTVSPACNELSNLCLAVVRNLIYLIRLCSKIPLLSKKESNCIADGALWVLHHVGNLAYNELKHHRYESTRCREALVNLIAGIVVVLGDDFSSCSPVVGYILKHLTRELNDSRLPETLLIRTNELSLLIKEKLGTEIYSKGVIEAQTKLSAKRLERRCKAKEEVVKNPQAYLQKKRKRQESKKVSKKRKLMIMKGKPF